MRSIGPKLLLSLLLAAPLSLLAPDAEACKHAMRDDSPDLVADAPRIDLPAQVTLAASYLEQGAYALSLRTIARAYPELAKLNQSYKKASKSKRAGATGHSPELYEQAAAIAAAAIARSQGRVAFTTAAKDITAEKTRLRQLTWAVGVMRHAVKLNPDDAALKDQLQEALAAHPKHQDEAAKLAAKPAAAESAALTLE
jgi:hypothetical protein